MNVIKHYTELMGFNSEAALAMAIKESLEKGLVVDHSKMIVMAGKGEVTVDPATHAKISLSDGIHARMKSESMLSPAVGPWSRIAPIEDIEQVAQYLAHVTPAKDRYGMMVDLLTAQVQRELRAPTKPGCEASIAL